MTRTRRIVAADLLSLAILTPPGGWEPRWWLGGALGVPMGFGGPHAGYFATRDVFKRHMPGGLVGVSVDAAGAPARGWRCRRVATHPAREQRPTSAHCAGVAGGDRRFYAVWHGPEGLKRIARRVNLSARRWPMPQGAAAIACGMTRFDTIVVECDDATRLRTALGAGFEPAPRG